MFKLKDMLILENPDAFYYPNTDNELSGGLFKPLEDYHVILWKEGGVAFGYYKNEMFVSYPNDTHEKLAFDINNLHYPDDDISGRGDMKYPGRYWPRHKVITFWDYPPKNKFKSVIKDLERASGEKIWNNRWFVEIVLNDAGKISLPKKNTRWQAIVDNIGFVKVTDFAKFGSKKHEPVDHMVSPMLKKKKKVPKGVGSRKFPADIKSGETMAQYRNRKKNENKRRKY